MNGQYRIQLIRVFDSNIDFIHDHSSIAINYICILVCCRRVIVCLLSATRSHFALRTNFIFQHLFLKGLFRTKDKKDYI